MDLNPPPPSPSSFTNFPILAIALLAMMVTGFLLVSYYIYVIKCCLNWPHLQSYRNNRGLDATESWLAFSSPATDPRRGLDELVIRDLPTLKYERKETSKSKTGRGGSSSSSRSRSSSIGEMSFRGCSVCLSSFEDKEMLRVLPQCGHLFHLDCIDIWLLHNANCPLCRAGISGGGAKTGALHPPGQMVAPNSSPQDPPPDHPRESSNEFVAVDLVADHLRAHHHGSSMMGDECINARRETLFDSSQTIRRSFSMDSALDQQLLLQVQQIIKRNRRIANEAAGPSNGRSSRRSFFSFGNGLASKSAILPLQCDDL